MAQYSFNDRWQCRRTGAEGSAFAVTLPHDAMLLDPKSETSPGGVNNGWIDARDYTYEKRFVPPAESGHCITLLEFEGVYRKGMVP